MDTLEGRWLEAQEDIPSFLVGGSSTPCLGWGKAGCSLVGFLSPAGHSHTRGAKQLQIFYFRFLFCLSPLLRSLSVVFVFLSSFVVCVSLLCKSKVGPCKAHSAVVLLCSRGAGGALSRVSGTGGFHRVLKPAFLLATVLPGSCA